MGVSENVVYHCTQWFCWSLSLWKIAISLGILTQHFQTNPYILIWPDAPHGRHISCNMLRVIMSWSHAVYLPEVFVGSVPMWQHRCAGWGGWPMPTLWSCCQVFVQAIETSIPEWLFPGTVKRLLGWKHLETKKPNLRKSSELFIVISKTWKQHETASCFMLSKESHASCQGGPLHWNKLLGFNSVS